MNKNLDRKLFKQSIDKFEQDFGFELTDRLEPVIIEDDYQKAMDIIVPFLNALKKDPEKEVIKWPNRIAVIEGLLDKLYKIKE